MGLFASLDSRSNPLVPWHALSADVSSESGLTRASEAVLTSALVRLASPTLWPRWDAETLSARALFSPAAIFGGPPACGTPGPGHSLALRSSAWAPPRSVLLQTFCFYSWFFKNCYLMPWSFKPNFFCVEGGLKKRKKKIHEAEAEQKVTESVHAQQMQGGDIQCRDGKWNRKSVMRKSCFCRLQSFSHCALYLI